MIEKLDLEWLRTEFQMLKKKMDSSSLVDSSLSDKALALEVIIWEVQRKINYKEQWMTWSTTELNRIEELRNSQAKENEKKFYDKQKELERLKKAEQDRLKLHWEEKLKEQEKIKLLNQQVSLKRQLDKLTVNMNAETKNKVTAKIETVLENTKSKLEAETDLNKKRAIDKKILLLTFVRDYFVNSTNDLNLEELLKVE